MKESNAETLTPQDLIDQVADKVIDLYPGDLHAAAQHMETIIRADERLKAAIFDTLIRQACLGRVQLMIRQRNQARWRESASIGKVEASDPDARLRRAISHSYHSQLMKYQLKNGKPLALATRLDLDENIEMQNKQATRMMQTVSWLRLIRLRLQADEDIVRDVLSEEDLVALQGQAISSINTILSKA